MTALPFMPDLRSRLDGLPLDRAPLRRAGLLAVLLVVLLGAGKLFGPDRAAALAPPSDRQELQADPESVSAARPTSGWTGGRVIALLLLVAGGGFALVLHRRRAPSAPRSARIDVMETHALGPGQTLQLVACGDEVLLLCVGEQTRLLRHWPRAEVDAGTASFADALAQASSPAPTPAGVPSLPNAPLDLDPPSPDLPSPDPSAADWLADLIAAEEPAAPEPVALEPVAPRAAAEAPVAPEMPRGFERPVAEPARPLVAATGAPATAGLHQFGGV